MHFRVRFFSAKLCSEGFNIEGIFGEIVSQGKCTINAIVHIKLNAMQQMTYREGMANILCKMLD